jgi:hypothetical protein
VRRGGRCDDGCSAMSSVGSIDAWQELLSDSMSEVELRSAFNIVSLSLAKSEPAIELRLEVEYRTDLRLLDTYGAEVDSTTVDAPAEPRHQRVLDISVASGMYPAMQDMRHDDSFERL